MTKVYFLLKLIAIAANKKNMSSESLTVIHRSCGAKLQ